MYIFLFGCCQAFTVWWEVPLCALVETVSASEGAEWVMADSSGRYLHKADGMAASSASSALAHIRPHTLSPGRCLMLIFFFVKNFSEAEWSQIVCVEFYLVLLMESHQHHVNIPVTSWLNPVLPTISAMQYWRLCVLLYEIHITLLQSAFNPRWGRLSFKFTS